MDFKEDNIQAMKTTNPLEEALGPYWHEKLKEEFQKEYMVSLSKGLTASRANRIIYPEPEDVFKAFRMTSPESAKVVLLGQDPYSGGEANGLSFDCSRAGRMTPSWLKMWEEYNREYPDNFTTDLMDGNLERWARSGIFLLNASLTVVKGAPGSHMKYWQPFTDRVFEILLGASSAKVFILLGGFAGQYAERIEDSNRDHGNDRSRILKYEHPAYAARNSRRWNAEGIFSKTNRILEEMGKKPVDW